MFSTPKGTIFYNKAQGSRLAHPGQVKSLSKLGKWQNL